MWRMLCMCNELRWLRFDLVSASALLSLVLDTPAATELDRSGINRGAKNVYMWANPNLQQSGDGMLKTCTQICEYVVAMLFAVGYKSMEYYYYSLLCSRASCVCLGAPLL